MPAHQVTASENAKVPVTRATSDHTTSSQDCGSRSGVSAWRQNPSPARPHRYLGVGAVRPSISRIRSRSNRAEPRATITPTQSSRTPPMMIESPTPRARSVTTTTNPTSAIGKAESA